MKGSAKAGGKDARQPTEVAEFYDDEISRFLAELAGGSLHLGYWDSELDGSSMAEASVRLTDLLVAKIGVGLGDRVLDVGCGSGAPAVRLAVVTGASVVGVSNSGVQVGLAGAAAVAAGVGERVSFVCGDASVVGLGVGGFVAV